MKAEILPQIECNDIYIENREFNAVIIQDLDYIIVNKSSIPDLIKILQSFIEP